MQSKSYKHYEHLRMFRSGAFSAQTLTAADFDGVDVRTAARENARFWCDRSLGASCPNRFRAYWLGVARNAS